MVTDENAVSDSAEQTTSEGSSSPDAKIATESASDSQAKLDSTNGDVDAVKDMVFDYGEFVES